MSVISEKSADRDIDNASETQASETQGNPKLLTMKTTLRRQRGGIVSHLTKLENIIRDKMKIDVSVESEITDVKDSLDKLIVKTMEIKDLASEEVLEKHEADIYYEKVRQNCDQLFWDIKEWKKTVNVNEAGDVDIKPEDSASQVGGSCVSSTSSRSKVAAAKVASLRVRADALKKQQQIKRELMELQLQEEALKIDTDIAAAEAEQEVMCSVSKRSSHRVENVPVPQHVQYDDTLPVQLELLNMMHLPRAEIMTYDGDPLRYWIFVKSFDNAIGSAHISDSAKLTRLLQYCTGKALSVIECCAVLPPETGYSEARRILNDRFGNNFVISKAWIKKVTEGPQLKAGDNSALRIYADSVRSCIVTLSAMNRINELDNQARMSSIVEKLPGYLQGRWRKEAVNHLQKRGQYPNIHQLNSFVGRAADEANDPVFGHPVLDNTPKPSSKPHVNKPKISGFQTSVKGNVQSSFRSSCLWCNGEHAVYTCLKFKQLLPEERLKFMMEKKLCFNCFAKNHTSYGCSKSSMCRADGCGRKHSTLLHEAVQSVKKSNGSSSGDSSKDETARKSATSVMECGTQTFSTHNSVESAMGAGIARTALPVVAVMVKGPGQRCVRTYAFLDSGSTNSFCSNELIEQLGVSGTKTSLSLTTLTNENCRSETTCVSLDIADVAGRNHITLPYVFVIPQLPIPDSSISTQADVKKWPHLQDIHLPSVDGGKITILIGQDNPIILTPQDVRRGKPDEPYGVCTVLGWTLNGPLEYDRQQKAVSNYFIQMEPDLQSSIERFFKLDHGDLQNDTVHQMSVQDKHVISLWENSIKMENSHYSLPIPFKRKDPVLPDNYLLAERRLSSLAKRLSRNEELHGEYSRTMMDLVERGYAERVDTTNMTKEGRVWYLPHHPVIGEKKLRIVFDCSAHLDGVSLNSEVLQGPDLTNKLLSVLIQFRQDRVAIMGDIEAMFHQVRVDECHRDALRFLWWPDGDTSLEPEVFRMTVHLFGDVWSPSCASFAVRRTAQDNADNFDPETRGGFNITKWISNSRRVIEAIPYEKRAKQVKDVDIGSCALPQEKALGVVWDTEHDKFGFTVKPKVKPHTRRGVISVISSIYDPFGFVCPVTLNAKKLFQNECRLKKGWDQALEPPNEVKWSDWLRELHKIENITIPRCLFPPDLGDIVRLELHHFSDASSEGYGAVSYLRMISSDGSIHCSFMLAKSRLAPIRAVTIPRLELSAAVISVKLNEQLLSTLKLKIDKSVFWTDSMVVLHQIKSESLRFQTFVANRISLIHEATSPEDWRHVDSERNPADYASRGLSASDIVTTDDWLSGSDFLWHQEGDWPVTPDFIEIPEGNMEIKKTTVFLTEKVEIDNNASDRLMERYSSWDKLRKAVSWILRLKDCLRHRAKGKSNDTVSMEPISVNEWRVAELEIVKYVQSCAFQQELKCLQKQQPVTSSSSIVKLEPVLNAHGILCISGRLGNAHVSDHAKHQMILPKNHHVVRLLGLHAHISLGHSGTEHMLSYLRQRFWIVCARVMLKRIMRDCVHCHRIHASPNNQRMADLPEDRVTANKPPFTYVGVDCFGPFEVKRGRSRVKRYGCLFTCLTTRSVHIEMLSSLDTDSFINALQRFQSRRGKPEKIRSDNGTNFRGAQRELKAEIQAWNQSKIQEHLTQKDIVWEFNPPTASHMGGVWERQIRSVRKVLNGLLKNSHGLSDECLNTLFCEVEAIINSRPITVVSDNVKDPEALTPNHLLLLRSSNPMPPGVFTSHDVYGRRWRHVQHLANVFWKRWIREYLPTLQLRQKWLKPTRNISVGDIVLISDENTPRKLWPLSRVLEVYPGRDGLVRSVQVQSRGTTLIRPVHKLCLLESVNIQ